MNYYYKNGNSITLGKELAQGGEGVVYDVDDSHVAKIYFEPQGRIEKMLAFQSKALRIKGVCTPQDLLYDANNNFCGFTMYKAGGKSLQTSIFQPKLFKTIFPNWTKVELTKLALNILEKIKILHSNDILVGDINPYNINVVD